MKPKNIPVTAALEMYERAVELGTRRDELNGKIGDINRNGRGTVEAVQGLRGGRVTSGDHGQTTDAVVLETCSTDDGARYYKVGEVNIGADPHTTNPRVLVRFGVAFDTAPPESGVQGRSNAEPDDEHEQPQPESTRDMYGRGLYCYWTYEESSTDEVLGAIPNADVAGLDAADTYADSMLESIGVINKAANDSTRNFPRSSRGDS